MRYFLILLLVSAGVASCASQVAPREAASVVSKATKKPFLVVERLFPSEATVHKVNFFFEQVLPAADFPVVKDLYALPMNQESEAALKEFAYPRSRSVLMGEDFAFGESLAQLIVLMDKTITDLKKSKQIATELAVKFDFSNPFIVAQVACIFKKVAGKIIADVHISCRQAEASQELVNFLQVLLCDDSVAQKGAKIMRKPGVIVGGLVALYVGFIWKLLRKSNSELRREILSSPSARKSNSELRRETPSSHSEVIEKITNTYPNHFDEFKRLLGTSIMWAKYKEDPRIAIVVVMDGDPVESLKNELKEPKAAELRGVEHYVVVCGCYDAYDVFFKFTSSIMRNCPGFVFPMRINTDFVYYSNIGTQRDTIKRNLSYKRLFSPNAWLVLLKAVCARLKGSGAGFTNFRDNSLVDVASFEPNKYVASFEPNKIDFQVRSERVDAAVEKPRTISENTPDILLRVAQEPVGDESPLLAQTRYTGRAYRQREKNYIFYDALFVVYRDVNDKLVLVANGKKETYDDFEKLVQGLADRVVGVTNLSKWLDDPALCGMRSYGTRLDVVGTSTSGRREFKVKPGTSSEVYSELCGRLDSAGEALCWFGGIKIHELCKSCTPEDIEKLAQDFRKDDEFHVVVCNLSSLSTEVMEAFKTLLSNTSDIAARYKIYVIQDTETLGELAESPSKGSDDHLKQVVSEIKGQINMCLLMPDSTGADDLASTIQKSCFAWLRALRDVK